MDISEWIKSILSVDFLFNAVLYLIYFTFFHYNLQKKYRPAITNLILCGCFLLYFVFSKITVNLSFLRMMAGPLFTILPVLLLYKDRLLHKGLLVLLQYLSAMFTELLVPVSLLTPEQLAVGIFNLPILMQMVIILAYLAVQGLLLFGITILWKRIQKKNRNSFNQSLPPVLWAVLFASLISQYILLVTFLRLLALDINNTGNITTLAAAFLLVFSDAGLLLVLNRQMRLADLEMQNALQKQMLTAQENYYSHLNEQYQVIRQMRHDIDNHLFTMQILLENNEIEDAKQYSKEIKERMGQKQDDSHPTAKAFLEHRRSQLQKDGIRLAYTNAIPKELRIPDMDLITALGNLLDNAAEACRETEEKSIRMDAEYKNGYLVIQTQNPFAEEGKAKKRRIPEMDRGLGTKILNDLAERYDGEYRTEISDQLFHARLVLKCSE